ncbi:serine kinase [Starkeya sp. ORNL1]|uniref:HPr kinase/phosphorylase n=1 Tax=Starkeya sp. ORNL1 TaxID=2709380 RepID=UPI001462F205|nr:HPr kinase/phosphatase C-terminal domain-containing protein [Starkeya sp. ORNL1]QJP14869.1 serine kinase [Starkeya sp. ORNL1]
MSDDPASIHGSCVVVGETGVLIRGPSGAGKSELAFALILAGRSGVIPPVRLVADDRVIVTVRDGRLLAAVPDAIAGLIEVRGIGIRRLPFASEAVIGLVIDLAAPDGARLPQPEALRTVLDGVIVPRLPIAPGADPLLPVIALLTTQDASP